MKRINITRRYFAQVKEWHGRLLQAEQAQPVTPDFDETTDEDIAAISAEIGASGARRPPSE